MRKLIVPVVDRRAARGGRVHDVRRRGPQDAHRPVPAHHRDLRGQRRPGPRRPGRHRRHGHPVRHRRGRHDVLRRRGRSCPSDAQAVIISPSVVGDRYVQLTPVYDGRRGAGRRRHPRRRADLGPARARRDLRQPRQAQRGARPHRRQPQRCALRPARGHRRQLRWPGRAVQRDHPQLRRVQPDAERQPRRVLRLRRAHCRASSARSPTTTRPSATSTSRSRQVSTVLEGEREELAAALQNLAVALGEVSTFVRDNEAILGRNIEGLNRFTKVLAKQRDALDQILKIAPTALNNLALTYNPQAGTLDTRSNLGEIGGQIDVRPGDVPVRLRQPGRRPRARPATIIQDSVPRAGGLRRASRARTPAGRTVRPDPRRTRGGDPMTRISRGLKGLLAATAVAVGLSGCDFSVDQHAAARRHRRRGRPDRDHGGVRATCSTWCRSRRSRSTTSASARSPTSTLEGETAVVTHGAAAATSSCPTTPSPRSGRPACWARSSSSSPRPRPAPATSRSRTATSSSSPTPAATRRSRRCSAR